MVLNRRTIIYIVSIVFVVAGIYGMTKLKTSGRVVDDMPKKEKMYHFYDVKVNRTGIGEVGGRKVT